MVEMRDAIGPTRCAYNLDLWAWPLLGGTHGGMISGNDGNHRRFTQYGPLFILHSFGISRSARSVPTAH